MKIFITLLSIYSAIGIVQAVIVRPNLTEHCPDPDPNNIRYLLWVRENGDNKTIVDKDNINILNSKNKTIVIAPGRSTRYYYYNIPLMRKTYLNRYDANVIIVDWYKESTSEKWGEGECKAFKVGMMLGKFLCSSGIPLDSVHLVGHSSGSHLSGSAGKQTQITCNRTIDRITGLDPSGRIFKHVSHDQRLNRTDASFVDVIHTKERTFSYFGNLGSIDFHVNCGDFQPACVKNASSVTSRTPKFCSGIISINYMIESINLNDFLGESCTMCPYMCEIDKVPELALMGEYVSRNIINRIYFVPVRNKSPYGTCTNCTVI